MKHLTFFLFFCLSALLFAQDTTHVDSGKTTAPVPAQAVNKDTMQKVAEGDGLNKMMPWIIAFVSLAFVIFQYIRRNRDKMKEAISPNISAAELGITNDVKNREEAEKQIIDWCNAVQNSFRFGG